MSDRTAVILALLWAAAVLAGWLAQFHEMTQTLLKSL